MKLLAMIFVLSGCVTTEQLVVEAEQAIVNDVCSVWEQISYDSINDTPETVSEVQANNRAQSAYCAGEK
jgi:hypothetical protein